MRRIILCAVLALAGGSATWFASNPLSLSMIYLYKPVIRCETKVVYETRTIPYTKEVTKYDHCGKAYTSSVIGYKEVEVPVRKTTLVTKWVTSSE